MCVCMHIPIVRACNSKITTIETHRDARYWLDYAFFVVVAFYFCFVKIPRLSSLMRRNYDTMTGADVY